MDVLNYSEAKDLLRLWRESNCRKSEDVIFYWQTTLARNLNKLGNEKQLVLEQVCIAALDCYRLDIVRFCIKQLLHEFPGSLRVRKFRAMLLEADERYDDALDVLDALIKEDKANSAPKKRKIAILKAQGRTVEAIKELTDYLKIFMADVEAWQELSELYIIEQDFLKAAFCVEELILHNPHNHLLHQRYADIRYTMGGLDNMELARNYYCQAIKLNPQNLRSLYGLFSAASNIASHQKVNLQKKKEATKLAEMALKKIQSHYDDKQVEDAESLMGALQIS